jgi:hypothetical protein
MMFSIINIPLIRHQLFVCDSATDQIVYKRSDNLWFDQLIFHFRIQPGKERPEHWSIHNPRFDGSEDNSFGKQLFFLGFVTH